MRLVPLLVAAALAGCTTNIEPSASELKARWDAENVFPQRYRQDLLAFLRTYLNDPSHVRGAGVSQPQLKYIGPGIATLRACATTRAIPMENIRVQKTVPRSLSGQARPFLRYAARTSVNSAKMPRMRRFPNWRTAHALARATCNNRRAAAARRCRFRQTSQ